MKQPNAAPVVDTLRISDAEAIKLFQQLNSQQAKPPEDGRGEQRIGLTNAQSVLLQVHQGHGKTANFLVRPRNISKNGIGFLHGAYLHNGTQCSLTFQTRDGGKKKIHGKVVRCQHIHRAIHEIGLRLTCDPDAEVKNKPSAGTQGGAGLSGRVLLVEPNEDDRAYLQALLSQIDLSARAAHSAADVLGSFDGESIDLLLLDLDGCIKTAADLVNTIREADYSGPIIGLTASCKPVVLRTAMGLGIERLLTKPFGANSLRHVLGQVLGADSTSPTPLLSELHGQPAMKSLIENFLGNLETYCDQIESMRATPNDEQMAALSLRLRSTAGNLGYPLIAAAALRLHELTASDEEAQAIAQQIDEVIELAMVARNSKA